ncbi:hypothetical protein [Paenibacillus piri]|uniref:hypothetical protein n=1 Tax=Paenibacillus piri TaxID=2547395 RepID=UPI0015F2B917|nr:hypothetical protein [Paenibacillus piri]
MKDRNEVYQYLGEVSISASDNQILCSAIQAHLSDRSESLFTVTHQQQQDMEYTQSTEKGASA